MDRYRYDVRIETRDEYENVIDSELVDRFNNKDDAIECAKEMRDEYETVVIEKWDYEDDLMETYLETDY